MGEDGVTHEVRAMTISELISWLEKASTALGPDVEVGIETQRGGDPGTPLVIGEVEMVHEEEPLALLVAVEQ